MGKESFLIYKSFYKPISKLSDEQLGRLFRAIFEYNINGSVCVESDIEMAFEFFRNQFNIDEDKYRTKIEKNRENGRRGGNQRRQENPPDASQSSERYHSLPNTTENEQSQANATERYHSQANQAYNDNENENDNDLKKELSNDNSKKDECENSSNALPVADATVEKEKSSAKKEKGFPKYNLEFVSEEYRDIFLEWLEYKRSRGESYKNQKSVETCYRQMLSNCGNDPAIARLMVEQSIGNNYSGLFALKRGFSPPQQPPNKSELQKAIESHTQAFGNAPTVF